MSLVFALRNSRKKNFHSRFMTSLQITVSLFSYLESNNNFSFVKPTHVFSVFYILFTERKKQLDVRAEAKGGASKHNYKVSFSRIQKS